MRIRMGRDPARSVNGVAVLLLAAAASCGGATRLDAGKIDPAIEDGAVSSMDGSSIDRSKLADVVDAGEDPSPPTAPQTLFHLSDRVGFLIQPISDSEGNVVVAWGEYSGPIHSLYWDTVQQRWFNLESVQAEWTVLADPHGSRYPVRFSYNELKDGGRTAETVSRRFDPDRHAWGPPVRLPGAERVVFGDNYGVDGTGDAFAFWREGEDNFCSRLPLAGSDWEPPLRLEEIYLLAAGKGNTFMWADRNDLRVRRFDRERAKWSDPVVLPESVSRSFSRMRTLVVGNSGAALLASLRRDADRVTVEAWRYDPAADAWGELESVMVLPTSAPPDTLQGPIRALTHQLQDLIWVPAFAQDGTPETHIARYDPSSRRWTESRAIEGTTMLGAPQLDLSADDHGRVFGGWHTIGLLRIDPGAQDWIDTRTDPSLYVWTSGDTAFGASWNNEGALVGMKAAHGGAWTAAKVLPDRPGAFPGRPAIKRGAAGRDRGLVLWMQDYGPDRGLWASFIE
jgi:hypothetical protein